MSRCHLCGKKLPNDEKACWNCGQEKIKWFEKMRVYDSLIYESEAHENPMEKISFIDMKLNYLENEIRKTIPITYLNIWDDYPAPLYNRAFYEACDLLMGISKQTVNINKLVLGDKAESRIVRYVPHGLNHDIFKPIDAKSPELIE